MDTVAFPHRTEAAFGELVVADAMTTGVISCPVESSLRAVARLMASHHVHAVYVFDFGSEGDESATLWGLVSDLDLVAAARGDFAACTAGRSSVTPLVTVSSDDSLDHAAQLMVENDVSHLAVLDSKAGRPVGVLSTLDLARVLATGAQP